MNFTIHKTKISIDFSFFLLLSFAVFYGYKNAVLIVLFSSLHELGHLLFLILIKAYPQRIIVSFYGISMKYNNKISKFYELLVIICGPAVNLILYLILKDDINLALLIINLYPVLPLDGGRIVYLLSEKISKVITIIFLILLMTISIYLFIFYQIFSVLLITVYLIIFNLKQMRFI